MTCRTGAAIAAVASTALLGVATAAALRSARRHGEETRQLVARLSSGRDAAPDADPNEAGAAAALPAPVARYLRLALLNDSPAPRMVRIEQTGELRTDVQSRRWMPFDAVHTVAPLRPGFVWNAKVGILPLLHVRVLDSLVDGVGTGRLHLMSSIEVDHDAGTAAMNSGSLHRFLAEAVW